MKAIIFGEVIWDIYPDKKAIGGAPFNFAANLSLLGNEVYLMTSVGNDELGMQAMEYMEKYGVSKKLVTGNKKPTGQCTVTLSNDGIPQYKVHTDTAFDNIEINEDILADIKKTSADVFYFNTLIQRSHVSAAALRKILNECSFNEIFCDVNIREGCYSKESILLCMEKATTVKISDEEIGYLYTTGILPNEVTCLEDICQLFPNIKKLVFTEGAKGSRVYDALNGKMHICKNVPKTKVVSTVGAGDCYGATFLHSMYMGKSIDDAIEYATDRSAKVVESYEAIIE